MGGYIKSIRAAINVEYVLLIVAGALAVVLGLGYLSGVMNDKHIEVAEALEVGEQPAEPAAELAADAATHTTSGIYDIAWSGGTAPYDIYLEGVSVGTTSDTHISVAPYDGTTIYEIRDASSTSVSISITTALACVDCHEMTDLNHTQHASLGCTSDCHLACRDLATAQQGDPLCLSCHAAP